MPLDSLNHMLPLCWKFLPAIYVALSNDKVLGLVWLSRDGYRVERWKVDRIILDPEAYSALDVGKELLYFVMNQFGAKGVETFLACVAPHDDIGLALLKDCGFRHCTKSYMMQLEDLPEIARQNTLLIEGLREARSTDARKLQELYSETLVPEVRISLRKSPEDLYPPVWEGMIRRCRGEFEKRWVISQGSRDYLSGSISFSTRDYKFFSISLLVSPGWEQGTEDLLTFALQKISQSCLNPKVSVEIYEFQKNTRDVLEKLGFTTAYTHEILVKDYWIPLKDRGLKLKNPVLLFAKGGNTSPA